MLLPGPTPRDPSVGASRPAHGEVEAELTYLSHADVKPVTYYTPGNDLPRRMGPHQWRPIVGPVVSMPFALCGAMSSTSEDRGEPGARLSRSNRRDLPGGA